MDLRKIKKLIELVEESAISELEVANGEERVRIVMRSAASIPEVIASPTTVSAPAAASTRSAGRTIDAPMAGTFYAAPNPEAAPFVQVGQEVAAGDVVCIIESMKMMHEIRADAAGTITELRVTNGTPVSTGDTLFSLT